MKKNMGYIAIIISIIIVFSIGSNYGNKPFERLEVDKIEDILLSTGLDQVNIHIKESNKIGDLSRVLKRIIIKEEEIPNGYEGHVMHFNLNMESGEKIQVGLYNPYVLIDGKSYKMKYGAGEQLRMLGYRYMEEALKKTAN